MFFAYKSCAPIRPLVKMLNLFLVVALLVGFTFVLQPAQPAYAAAVLTVDTTTDELASPGAGCSLREAITNANDNANTYPECYTGGTYGDDGIILPAGTYVLDIGATGEDFNLDGDLDILDGGDLIIEGLGAVIDGNNTERVFHVCPAGGCDIDVIFGGVTIQNGNALEGGGLYNNDGNTTLDTCTVSDNKVSGDGGGIYNSGGVVTVDACTIISNTADDRGGGIYNAGTLNVQNGSAIGGVGAPNTATDDGGGIYNGYGVTTVEDSTVSANTADDEGGGICNTVGATTVDASIIGANRAIYGGGIYNWDTLTVQNGSTIGGAGMANTADEGGGIYNYEGIATVDASTVSNNVAAERGGGIYNWETLNVQNGSTIGGVGAPNTADDGGGGIYNNGDGATTVGASTVSANAAGNGGGIYNDFQGAITVTGSRIMYNTAITDGGGVYNNVDVENAISVTGSCIVGNSAFSFYDATFTQQTATGDWWGAATGPNTPGADTTCGDVDTTGFLTAPPLFCLTNRIYLPVVLRNADS